MTEVATAIWRFPRRLAWLLAATALASGCLIVPTPEYNSGEARANLSKQTPQQFRPGQTTRAEVILALGEPDAVSPDERKLAYRSEKICGLWVISGGYGGAIGGAITKDRYVITEFDPSGVLVKAERASTWMGTEHASTLLGYGTNGAGPTPSVAGTAADARPAMTLRCSWFAGMDGFKGRGATESLGQMGRLVLGETRLAFFTDAEFANAGPVLTLAYDALTEVSVAKYFLGRRLVIRSRTGEPHSFQIYGPRGTTPDKSALQSAVNFLQARLKK